MKPVKNLFYIASDSIFLVHHILQKLIFIKIPSNTKKNSFYLSFVFSCSCDVKITVYYFAIIHSNFNSDIQFNFLNIFFLISVLRF